MKHFLIIVAAMSLLFSTGCSGPGALSDNYRPIDRLKPVHTIGLDAHPHGLSLSVCAGESENKTLLRLQGTGINITDAVSRLQEHAGKEELYYAHTRYVLVGEDYAKQGLENLLQYLESSSQLRTDLPLFIVKESPAADLVMAAGGKDSDIFSLLDGVMRDCTKNGSSFPFSCGDIGSFSAEYGSAPVCVLQVSETKSVDADQKEPTITPITAGYGVLKDGKLAGFLPESAAPAVNFLLNQPGTDPLTVTVSSRPVSIRITKTETALTPSFSSSGSLTGLTVGLYLEGVLTEDTNREDTDLERLGKGFSKIVSGWLTDVLQTMRRTEADFLGFFPRIAIDYPTEYSRSPIAWKSQLNTLPMFAEVQCRITTGENTPRR